MNEKAYLILKTDNSSWVATFDPETKKRMVYDLNAWALDPDPSPAIEPAESWLKHESSAIEAIFRIDKSQRTICLGESARLTYTEFLDDVCLYEFTSRNEKMPEA